MLGTLGAGIELLGIETGVAGSPWGHWGGHSRRAGVRKRGGRGQEWGCRDLTALSPGLQEGLATVSRAIAGTKGIELEISDYYTYMHPDPSTMPEPR